jgi:hypothetical protein
MFCIHRSHLLFSLSLLLFSIASFSQDVNAWKKMFRDPPAIYRPSPFWHLNGKLDTAEINRQLHDVKYASGFGGVTVLPVTAQRGFGSNQTYPGMEPAYLTKEYFDFYADILQTCKKLGLQLVWYDDVDFPSGTAGGQLQKQFPQDSRKILYLKDSVVAGNAAITMPIPEGKLMAAVAMNLQTKERRDLGAFVKNGQLTWTSPGGEWKLMLFTTNIVLNGSINEIAVDYMDPQAIDRYFAINHDVFAQHFKSYFGNTIQQTFFDDVGFYTGSKRGEKTWTNLFNEKFKLRTGKDATLYYPALWGDIGPETQSARIAFFDTRAELLAEGYPRKATEWSAKYAMKASGHPPGNYEIQPVDMNADIIKYYRHEAIPTMDLIFFYGHGREGYKLVSSAGNLYDRPVVAAEIYGAIGWFTKNEMDRKLLYRAAMDVFTRGINFLIPHGMWYNPDSNAVRIPPLISAYSKEIGPELPAYNAWAGRSCMLLQGGQTVSEIAVVYPIQSLEAFYYFDAKENKSVGKFAPPGTDYLAISDMLSNQLHRDFTFVHPETISSERFFIDKGTATLRNKVNQQTYHTIILSGGSVISLSALQKIKAFYDQGGSVIATSVLPFQSAEFGQDEKVVAMVKDLFGIDPTKPMPAETTAVKTNASNGRIIFIPKPDAESLQSAFGQLRQIPDVSFENNPQPTSGKGVLSYIHKRKDGKDIFLFANSSNDDIHTLVTVKGTIKGSYWNPHDGSVQPIADAKYTKMSDGQDFTTIQLDLLAVHSLFWIAD